MLLFLFYCHYAIRVYAIRMPKNLYDHAHRSPKKAYNNLIKWKTLKSLPIIKRIQMMIILLSTRSFAGLCIRLREMIFDFHVTLSPEQQISHEKEEDDDDEETATKPDQHFNFVKIGCVYCTCFRCNSLVNRYTFSII